MFQSIIVVRFFNTSFVLLVPRAQIIREYVKEDVDDWKRIYRISLPPSFAHKEHYFLLCHGGNNLARKKADSGQRESNVARPFFFLPPPPPPTTHTPWDTDERRGRIRRSEGLAWAVNPS